MTAILSPCTGVAVGLQDVPDPVFAGGLLGPGLAVEPEDGEQHALSPVAGRVLKVHPHAFVVVHGERRGILVHLGIDTVSLGGEGFTVLREQGDDVEAGTPLISWDPQLIRARGLWAIVRVVAVEATAEQISSRASGRIMSGAPLFTDLR